MEHHKLERFLKSWIDGELEPDQAAEVAAYLKSNPRAQAKVADYRKVADVIRRVTRVTPLPMPRPQAILRQARRRAQEERQVIQWLQRLTAAAAILLVSTVAILFVSSSAPLASSPADSAIVDSERVNPLRDEAMFYALSDPGWEIEYR